MAKYNISVPIDLAYQYPSLEGINLSEAYSIFSNLCNTATDIEQKERYYYCKTFLKYANDCGAALVAVTRKSKFIVRFALEFEDIRNIKFFLTSFPSIC